MANARKTKVISFTIRTVDNGHHLTVNEGDNASTYNSGGTNRVYRSEDEAIDDIRRIVADRLESPDYDYGYAGDCE